MRISTHSTKTPSGECQDDGRSLFGRLLSSPGGEEHRRAFQAWINLKLEFQLAELEEFLDSLPPHQRILLENRLASGSFTDLVPENTPAPERLLFETDLEIVLALKETC